jgi:N-acetylglucosaminyl-diphospho-decaprenol L-rhamnosyltransferase
MNAGMRGELPPHDLAIIIVSTNEAHWLTPCLTTVFERAGDLKLDVVVVDNESSDGTPELVEREFPAARIVPSRNRGFPHANNRALMTVDARYVLFLNPDTEILEGTLEGLVRLMDERPQIGLAGVRQLSPDGSLYPTIRRFPNAVRALGEAFASERLPTRGMCLGERELRPWLYERETACDWTTGSFMVARREALEGGGYMDERFFLYSDEPDLCHRIKQAGWEVFHMPDMTIVHHAGKAGMSSKVEAQNAYARLLYARKHFSQPHRAAYVAALLIRYALRGLLGGADPKQAREKRIASWRAVRTLLHLEKPPYGPPPATAVAPRQARN